MKEAAQFLSLLQVFYLHWGWSWVHLFISLSLCSLTYEIKRVKTSKSSLDLTSFVLVQLGEFLEPCLPMPFPTFKPSLVLLSLVHAHDSGSPASSSTLLGVICLASAVHILAMGSIFMCSCLPLNWNHSDSFNSQSTLRIRRVNLSTPSYQTWNQPS